MQHPLTYSRSRPKPTHCKVVRQTELSILAAAQMEIRDEESGRCAVLEFPIKTMNMGTDGKRWQVDTGPVVLPDLKAAPEQWSETLRLAFVAYNTSDWADYIIEAPPPVLAGGAEAEASDVLQPSGQRRRPKPAADFRLKPGLLPGLGQKRV